MVHNDMKSLLSGHLGREFSVISPVSALSDSIVRKPAPIVNTPAPATLRQDRPGSPSFHFADRAEGWYTWALFVSQPCLQK